MKVGYPQKIYISRMTYLKEKIIGTWVYFPIRCEIRFSTNLFLFQTLKNLFESCWVLFALHSSILRRTQICNFSALCLSAKSFFISHTVCYLFYSISVISISAIFDSTLFIILADFSLELLSNLNLRGFYQNLPW